MSLSALLAFNARSRMRTKVLMLRRASDPNHGTLTAYQRGCGCQVCRAVNKLAQRKKRGAA